jgi:hypothetical protein
MLQRRPNHAFTVRARLGFLPIQGETVVLKQDPEAGRVPIWWA